MSGWVGGGGGEVGGGGGGGARADEGVEEGEGGERKYGAGFFGSG